MLEIFLTRGLVAVIDAVDRPLVQGVKWRAHNGRSDKVYARGSHGLLLHRVIARCDDPDLVVDHADGDGLNCRRANLRVTLYSYNNHSRYYANRTGYRGVQRKWNRFQARISGPEGRICLGHYATALDAALAYDRAALEMFGPFAWTNFEREVDVLPEPEEEIPF